MSESSIFSDRDSEKTFRTFVFDAPAGMREGCFLGESIYRCPISTGPTAIFDPILGSEDRRWDSSEMGRVLRRPSIFEESLILDLRVRRTKNPHLRSSEPKDELFSPSSIFESSALKIEGPLHLRSSAAKVFENLTGDGGATSSKMGGFLRRWRGVLRFCGCEERRTSHFPFRNRKNEEPFNFPFSRQEERRTFPCSSSSDPPSDQC